MILVFTDMQTYHDEWEMNPKRISSSIVIAWSSTYRPRKDYRFYDCIKLMQPYLTDEEYDKYISDDLDFKHERAILSYLMTIGLDIVFLCNENETFFNDRLYDLLYNFQERYGIRPVYVKCVEDLPDIPKENDYFNIIASGSLEEDLFIIRMYIDNNKSSLSNEELQYQIKLHENML